MATWNYNSNEYTARNFAPIPEGDYRVTISNVTEKLFSSGNEGFEITFEVPNHKSKLWYYLVLDPRDSKKTNQRIGMFFDSFAIQDEDLSHYNNWIGRDGAVRVRHNQYNGEIKAGVAFCLSRSQQKKFPGFNSSYATQQGMTPSPSNSSGEQQNRFNGFKNHPAARMEFPEGFSF
jgi:hypothetical protein